MTAKLSDAGEQTERVDGRRAARQRNRTAVVDALLELYAEGNFSPSADEMAERSGVSRRSLFRYFDDLDDLCRAAIDRQILDAGPLIELKNTGHGTQADRSARLAAQRAALFEAIAPGARAGRLRAPYQPLLAEYLLTSRTLFRRQIERHFEPELAGMTDAKARRETLDAIDVLCSCESFDLLRTARGLSLANYERTLTRALTALLDAAARF